MHEQLYGSRGGLHYYAVDEHHVAFLYFRCADITQCIMASHGERRCIHIIHPFKNRRQCTRSRHSLIRTMATEMSVVIAEHTVARFEVTDVVTQRDDFSGKLTAEY